MAKEKLTVTLGISVMKTSCYHCLKKKKKNKKTDHNMLFFLSIRWALANTERVHTL